MGLAERYKIFFSKAETKNGGVFLGVGREEWEEGKGKGEEGGGKYEEGFVFKDFILEIHDVWEERRGGGGVKGGTWGKEKKKGC